MFKLIFKKEYLAVCICVYNFLNRIYFYGTYCYFHNLNNVVSFVKYYCFFFNGYITNLNFLD